MAKTTAKKTTTRTRSANPDAELLTKTTALEMGVPSFEYLGNGKVLMSITTKAGDVVAFTMAGDTFLKTVKASDELFNAHIWDIATALRLV